MSKQKSTKFILSSELKNTFNHGFYLDESALIRLDQTIRSEIKKLSEKKKLHIFYAISYLNGTKVAVADPTEIFREDNSGDKSIVSIDFHYHFKEDGDKSQIILSFKNIDLQQDFFDHSITLSIKSMTPDWSELVRKAILLKLSAMRRGWSFRFTIGGITFFTAWFLGSFTIFLIKLVQMQKVRDDFFQSLKSPSLQDQQRKIPEIVKKYEEIRGLSGAFDLWPYIKFTVLIGVLVLLYFYHKKYYSRYVFYIGDFEKVYSRNEKIRYTINILIGLTLIVSVVGSVLGNKFTPFF